jgi:acyl-CoA thioesterase-1
LLFCIVLALPVAAAEKSILVVGDSLSAAYGIPRDRGWVALLEERLKREQLHYSVVNASISGETSGGGRVRMDKLLERYQPGVVILALGGNDGLRGMQVAEVRANLAAMIREAQASNARVLLVGIKMPPNYGEEYTQGFDAMYRALASTHRTAFVPFLLEDFAGKPEFFLPDRIHPNEAAQALMFKRVWPALRPLLK